MNWIKMYSEREKYEKYISGKRVCLVGPSSRILELPHQRNFIDSYDIIVRLNTALPLPENLYDWLGTKTNILYNCLNPEPDSGGYLNIPFLQEQINWIVCPYPKKHPFGIDIQRFERQNTGRINFTKFNLEYYNLLEKKMQTRPNTGVLAILDLLSCDITEMYITGITFFKGGYIKEYRKYNEEQVLNRMKIHGNHRQPPQIEYMKKVLKNDSRISMDVFLEEIVNE